MTPANVMRICMAQASMETIRVLYDHQIFFIQSFGGISRYFLELMRHFDVSVRTDIAVRYTNNQDILAQVSGSRQFRDPTEIVPAIRFRGKTTIIRTWNYLANGFISCENRNARHARRRIAEADYDVFHPTYYDNYFLDKIERPFVLTIHDLTHERHPEFFSAGDIGLTNKRQLAERATRIIALSENTKKDIMLEYGIPSGKIDVIHHGNSLTGTRAATGGMALPPRYLLFVGTRRIYKNFDRMVTAIAPLLRSDPELHLICTGTPFTPEEKELLADLGILSRVLHSYADDPGLCRLYANAAAFIYPSLYEGFGLPILEAFSCRCPVICSSTSCFPEIAGNAAVYFNPLDEDSIRDAAERVLNDPALRKRMIEEGELREKEFSWDRAARLTAETYRRASKR